MNHPRFIVFLDPRPSNLSFRETWYPPKYQQDLVQQLVHAGFQPMTNSERQPTAAEMSTYQGLMLLTDGSLKFCHQYEPSDKVLCIQWYNEPLTAEELSIVYHYCAPFYNIGVARSYVTAEEQALLDRGCMTPPAPMTLRSAPTFLGNRVVIGQQDVNVIE